ncbi:MAG: Rne/Rng family ribonuclease [Sedimentisphaerales bacterium]|nr:Rne/Rng family ribonuclease [Sedimentisphaerales bacterium]
MTREMLINVAQEEECRIAVVEKSQLEELYVERLSETSIVGNIYKAKVVNIEPGIQACFVDFGIGKNGFLHISDLQPSYFQDKRRSAQKERVGRKRPRKDRPPIQECLQRGREILVQVIKGGIGTKGPTLSTYLSIPGRFLVLMPGMHRMGVSRKIEDEAVRARMREVLSQLDPPQDMGIIIRTAGMDRNKSELRRDLNYLMRLWKTIDKRIQTVPAPALLYQESDLVKRTLRDVFNTNIQRIHCDTEGTIKKVRDFLRIAMPRTRTRVNKYDGPVPLFEKYHIEEEIEKIHSRHVPLRSGGHLVIDTTEAIVAIDVNSGRYRQHADAESTSFKINMEAAPEIARQLRLRDLGGVIIIDFIDMMEMKHRRLVEKALRDAVATDRARTKILRISQFGIVEMTRQRMRPSLKQSTYADCPHCKGSGLIKTPESMSLEIMRRIQGAINDKKATTIEIDVGWEVADFLHNRKRSYLAELESGMGKTVLIRANRSYTSDTYSFLTRDSRGSVLTSYPNGRPADAAAGRVNGPTGAPAGNGA